MTTQEAKQKMKDMLTKIRSAEFMLPLVQSTHNKQVTRIFVKKLASDGIEIGKYSEEENGLYINPTTNIGSFAGQGKNGDKVFKSGAKHKTKYFVNYKAYRAAINKDTTSVNLRMTELLKIDYTNGLRFSDGAVISTVNSERNAVVISALIEKYGDRTFKLSTEEQKELQTKFVNKTKTLL